MKRIKKFNNFEPLSDDDLNFINESKVWYLPSFRDKISDVVAGQFDKDILDLCNKILNSEGKELDSDTTFIGLSDDDMLSFSRQSEIEKMYPTIFNVLQSDIDSGYRREIGLVKINLMSGQIQKIENWKGPFIDPFNGLPMINSQLTSLSSPVTPGFGLGFVSDFMLGNNANLRFTPGLVFADVIVNYEFENPSLSKQRIIQGTLVDLPLGIKLKSDRRKNFRAYVIGGAKYSIDIVSKKKTDDIALSPESKYLKSLKNTVWYEAGLGLDLYFEFFKLSPEIKFSQSRKSVLKDSDRLENPFTAPIDKLFFRNIQFSLFFE